MEGVDYQTRPGGATLRAAGKRFAVRYLAYPGATKPTLTATEKTDLLSHDVAIALVMEVYGDDCLRGYSWGAQLAQWAKASASALGFGSLPVYFAVDRDVNVGQRWYPPYHQTAVRNYLAGAASVVGHDRTGVYGGFYVIEWALSKGYAKWGWQTYAWSGGRVSSRAHLLQYNNYASVGGVAVDLDRSLKTDFGQYPRVGSVPDTASSKPLRIDGDPYPMRYKSLIENGQLTVHREMKSGKPIRKGASIGSGTWETTEHRRDIAPWGYIEKDDLPWAERQFGRVYLINVFPGGAGSAVGYVKAVDLV